MGLAFEKLQANRVEIRMDPRNLRSQRVAQRLGIVFEGTLYNCVLDADGMPSDRYIYARRPLTAHRWSGAGLTRVEARGSIALA